MLSFLFRKIQNISQSFKLVKKISLCVYQMFLWLPLCTLYTLLIANLVIIGCLIGFRNFFSYYPGWTWSRFMCIVTFCKVRVIGKEKLKKNQSYIFVANHQGIYDCWLIFGYLGVPIKWIMKKSLQKLPFVGRACKISGFIFVDRLSAKTAIKTIGEAKEKLKNGASIALFPEGSRTKTGKLGKFKKGAFQIATDLQLPIVPVTLNGSYEVMPRHTFLISPHKMEVIIHNPINTKNLSSGNIQLLSDLSKEKIESALWNQYK